MNSQSLNLPSLVLLDDVRGDWNHYLEKVYSVFRNDLIVNPPKLSRPFQIKKFPKVQGKEDGFWHLISEGKTEEDRLPNIRRCEHIGWIKPLVELYQSHLVRVWTSYRSTTKGRDQRLLIATPEFDYVVILSVRKNYYLLITAYPVEQKHRQERLKNEFKKSRKTGDTF